MLPRALVALAVAWPLVAGGAVWHRAGHPSSPSAGNEGLWSSAVYLAGGQICHQRPERSFATQNVQWPVCARCSGLYLAAPIGALAALFAGRRRYVGRTFRSANLPGLKTRPPSDRSPYVRVLALAAIPTALTLLWEWGGLGTPSNLWRFTTALPLGATIMWVLVRVAEPAQVDRIN